jgi:hypothetical protein
VDITLLSALKADQLKEWLLDNYTRYLLSADSLPPLPDDYKTKLEYLGSVVNTQNEIQNVKKSNFMDLFKQTDEITDTDEISQWYGDNPITDDDVKNILNDLFGYLQNLASLKVIPKESKNVYNHLQAEKCLLEDILKIDRNRDFYYTAASNPSLAIELNESKEELNTLMNPHVYYDINNVNNSFVISKLDIDFLDDGIQLARSSRLN